MTKQTIPIIPTFASFLFFLVSLIHGQATDSLPICSPSSCGDLHNISYPFRLKSEPSICGDPDYELDCEDNKTILAIGSEKYYVKQISYTGFVRVVDVNLANGSCSLSHRSLSDAELNRDRRFDVSLFTMWATFVNCSRPIDDDTAYVSVPCLSGNRAFVYVMYRNDKVYNIKESCELISMVPSRVEDLRNGTFGEIDGILEKGFYLDWSVGCRKCRLKGGSCDAFTFDITGCRQQYGWIKPIASVISYTFLVRFLLGALHLLAVIIYVVYRKCNRASNTKKLQHTQEAPPMNTTPPVELRTELREMPLSMSKPFGESSKPHSTKDLTVTKKESISLLERVDID